MDSIVTDARRRDGTVVDIEIRDGVIDRICDAGTGETEDFDPTHRYDAERRLVTASFTEPHVHLDTAGTAGTPRWNTSGTLAEGIRIWAERKESLGAGEVRERTIATVERLVANGVTRVRTHVDTTEESLTALDVLLDLRSELDRLIDIQIVAFPQDGLRADEAHETLLRDALDRGADAVGGIPHAERTREDGVKSVQTAVELAERFDKRLDLHIDETDDPQSRFTEVLAAEARDRGLGRETTASHVTAMHSYPNAYAAKLTGLLAESDVSVVTNPSANAVLQGRHDAYPRRRGHTRVDQLRASDVTVGIGQDSVRDPWYHYGTGDPLAEAFLLAHTAHMNGHDDVDALWTMLLDANEEIYGRDETGLQEGTEGSLIVFEEATPFDALRTRSRRRLVLKEGRCVARSTPAETTVRRDGDEHDVDF